MKTIGDYLKALRETKGLTLQELGEMLDVSISYISRFESGSRIPLFNMLQLYHKVFVDVIDSALLLSLWLKSIRKDENKTNNLAMIPVGCPDNDVELIKILGGYLSI